MTRTIKSHAVKTTARKPTPRERLVKAGRIEAAAAEEHRVAVVESQREIADYAQRLTNAHAALKFALDNNGQFSEDTADAVRRAYQAQITYDECRDQWQRRLTETEAQHQWAAKNSELAWEAVEQAEGH
ncbi:hypothetical protein [Kocuria palustris]|uniref:hypothetical protein n=1 Tax=Kocuria palustris TaxID=71999 RepID=UPI0011A61F84|nr:hypothetical protein [Kocuria palustris]